MWFKICMRCRSEFSWMPLSPFKSTRAHVVNLGWCDRCGPTAFQAAYDDDESRQRPGARGAPVPVLIVFGLLIAALLAAAAIWLAQ